MASKLAQTVYRLAPDWSRDVLVGGYGALLLAQRHRAAYFRWKRFYRQSAGWPLERLEAYQAERLRATLRRAVAESPFHGERLAGIDLDAVRTPADLAALPTMTKDDARRENERIATVPSGIRVQTGGTTGTPLEVVYASEDFQERQARLAVFRERHGAHHGMRRATFSGRILAPGKAGAAQLWRHNWALRQRLYSSFHLVPEHLDRYVEDLDRFRPEWIDGFPSSVYAVAKHALDRGHRFSFSPRVVFSTAETLYEWQREAFAEAFGCPTRNQYASSEGAPFIVECPEGNLHADLRTGVFETTEAGLTVTSFTTSGFPLIRYVIGDQVTFEDDAGPCPCGDRNPRVAEVRGRAQDSIVSPERGPVYVGLVDIFKAIPPVVQRSQIAQTAPDEVVLRLVVAPGKFRPEHEEALTSGLRERIGEGMKIRVDLVDQIPRDASGKYRFVKREF